MPVLHTLFKQRLRSDGENYITLETSGKASNDHGESARLDVLVPALLNRISNLPPVRFTISSLSAAMLDAFVTSSAKVSIPLSSKVDRDAVDRAVAKTRIPWAANSRARAFPTPPREHLLEVMFISSVKYEKKEV